MPDIDPSIMPHTLGGILGWIGTGALGLFTAWTQFRKGRVDETATVLTAWQEMVKRHEEELKRIADELRSERADNSALRQRLRAAEDRITDQDGIIRTLREEVAGLKRQIIQNSQSSVVVLGNLPSAHIDAAVERLNDLPSSKG